MTQEQQQTILDWRLPKAGEIRPSDLISGWYMYRTGEGLTIHFQMPPRGSLVHTGKYRFFVHIFPDEKSVRLIPASVSLSSTANRILMRNGQVAFELVPETASRVRRHTRASRH